MKVMIALVVGMVTTAFGARAQVGTTTGGPLTVAGVPIYGIADDGALYWYFHQGAHDGAPTWANGGQRVKVGENWNEGRNVFKGSPRGADGVVYSIDSKGDLYWHRHNGHATGADSWEARRKVGQGWQSARLVFAAGDGVIYVVDKSGDLFWYRHLGYLDGRDAWANQARGARVGVGWGGVRLAFAGGNGIIYAVDGKGDLYWYRHTGYVDGQFSWANRAEGKRIGNGWNDAVVAFSGGDGVIYVLKRNDELYWYENTGFATGAATWRSPTGTRIGTGWAEMVRIF